MRVQAAYNCKVALKAAGLYFAVVFGAGVVLGTLRALWLAPQTGSRAAELVEMPFMLAVMIVAALRIVRRLAEALGLKVEWLHRTSYGPVRLGTLAEGRHRPLTRREIAAIEEPDGAA